MIRGGKGNKRFFVPALILLTVLSAEYGIRPAWASDRLADFSNIVHELDAEAEAPAESNKKSGTSQQTALPPAVKQSAVTPPAVKQPAVKQPAATSPAVKQPEVKKPEVKQTEVKQSETKLPEAKRPAAKLPEVKQTDDRQSEVRQPRAKQYAAKTQQPAVKQSSAKQTDAAPAAVMKPGVNLPAGKQPAAGKASSVKAAASRTVAFHGAQARLVSVHELLLTAGAENRMSGKQAQDDGKAAGEGEISKSSQSQASARVVSGEGGDRLLSFASIVREAEAEAGIEDSDPENEPVLSASGHEDDERLSGLSKLAEDADGGDTPEDARLQEFAHLADEQGGEGADARLLEFAALSGGDADIADDRIVALARVSEEREEEMERKYGPRIEDNIVTSPGDYNDGDRVVATANTKRSSRGYYASGSWDRRDKDRSESGIGRLLESLYPELKDKDKGDGRGSRKSDKGFSVSGLFDDLKDKVSSFVYSDEDTVCLGTFTLTAYDACIKCCGKTDGITSTGTHAKAGRTIAVDPRVIPYGSKVMINGHVYIAEDTGGAIKGNKIDVYLDTHEQAVNFGRRTAEVYLVK